MANRVKFGLSNVHVSKITFNADGKPIFAVPEHIPGAVKLSLDPEGSTTSFNADNIKYYVSVSNNGYGGNLELAIVTDKFLIDHVGMEEIDGLIVEHTGAETAPFALLFQFEGDVSGTRHIIYNCNASRPKVEGKTVEDDKEPDTDAFDFVAAPLVHKGRNYVKAKTSEKTDKTKYDEWFTIAPTLPEAKVQG